MRSRKAQAAADYLITVGFAMLIIVAALGLFLTISNRSQKQIGVERINIVGKSLQANANLVYFQGEDSRVTLDADLPENLINLAVLCYNADGSLGSAPNCLNSEILFVFDDGSERVFLLPGIPMRSSITSEAFAGRKKLQVLVAKKDNIDFILLRDTVGGEFTVEDCIKISSEGLCDIINQAAPENNCCATSGGQFCC